MKRESILTDSPLVTELLHHLHEGQKSVKNFCGREIELRKLRNYLTRESCNTPLFVFGKGGSGKTALLSQACHLLQSEWCSPGTLTPLELLHFTLMKTLQTICLGVRPLLALRLCGSTQVSNSVLSLIQSLCQQMCYNLNIR